MISLITSFFYHSNASRCEEYKNTLKNNISKDFISSIHLFITSTDHEKFMKDDFEKDKLIFIVKNQQPTYKDFVEYSLNLKHQYCMITNSDIELSKIDIRLINNLKNNNIAYILTRYEYDDSKPLIDKYEGSHDSIIFYSDRLLDRYENTEDKHMNFINITQNNGGSEALMTYWLIEYMKFELFNPCYQIKIIHHHKSNIRQSYKILAYTYNSKIYGDKYFYNPHMIYPQIL